VRVSAQGLDHTRAGAESHILTASISGGPGEGREGPGGVHKGEGIVCLVEGACTEGMHVFEIVQVRGS
jgi:hypothetical protein